MTGQDSPPPPPPRGNIPPAAVYSPPPSLVLLSVLHRYYQGNYHLIHIRQSNKDIMDNSLNRLLYTQQRPLWWDIAGNRDHCGGIYSIAGSRDHCDEVQQGAETTVVGYSREQRPCTVLGYSS